MRQANPIQKKYATREKNPTNTDNMIYYSEDFPAEYEIVVDEESVISFAAQIAATPGVPTGSRAETIRVDIETKTISKANWEWNPATSVLTLFVPGPIDGQKLNYPTSVGQLVSIIYKIKKTVL